MASGSLFELTEDMVGSIENLAEVGNGMKKKSVVRKTNRKQYQSCDSCRVRRVKCDLPELSDELKVEGCTKCKKRGMTCTTEGAARRKQELKAKGLIQRSVPHPSSLVTSPALGSSPSSSSVVLRMSRERSSFQLSIPSSRSGVTSMNNRISALAVGQDLILSFLNNAHFSRMFVAHVGFMELCEGLEICLDNSDGSWYGERSPVDRQSGLKATGNALGMAVAAIGGRYSDSPSIVPPGTPSHLAGAYREAACDALLTRVLTILERDLVLMEASLDGIQALRLTLIGLKSRAIAQGEQSITTRESAYLPHVEQGLTLDKAAKRHIESLYIQDKIDQQIAYYSSLDLPPFNSFVGESQYDSLTGYVPTVSGVHSVTWSTFAMETFENGLGRTGTLKQQLAASFPHIINHAFLPEFISKNPRALLMMGISLMGQYESCYMTFEKSIPPLSTINSNVNRNFKIILEVASTTAWKAMEELSIWGERINLLIQGKREDLFIRSESSLKLIRSGFVISRRFWTILMSLGAAKLFLKIHGTIQKYTEHTSDLNSLQTNSFSVCLSACRKCATEVRDLLPLDILKGAGSTLLQLSVIAEFLARAPLMESLGWTADVRNEEVGWLIDGLKQLGWSWNTLNSVRSVQSALAESQLVEAALMDNLFSLDPAALDEAFDIRSLIRSQQMKKTEAGISSMKNEDEKFFHKIFSGAF